MLKNFHSGYFVKLEQDNDKFVLYRVSFQNVRNINIMTQELNKSLMMFNFQFMKQSHRLI